MADSQVESAPLSISEGKPHRNRGQDKKNRNHMNRPEIVALKNKINDKRNTITALYAQLNELTSRTSQLRESLGDYTNQREALHKQLDAVTAEIETYEADKAALTLSMNELVKASRDKKSKMQSLKRNLKFQTEEEVDEQIKALDRALIAQHLTVTEENKLIARIKQLKASKPLLGQCANMESDTNDQASVLPLKTRFEEIKEKLRLCFQKKRELSETLRALIQSNKVNLEPVTELVNERDRVWAKIVEHKAEESKLNLELNAKIKDSLLTAAQQNKEEKEKRLVERMNRDKIHEREMIERELLFLESKTTSPGQHLVEQMISYITKLLEVSESKSEERSPEPTLHDDTRDLDGVSAYVKSNKEESFYVTPKHKKKTDKKKKQATISTKQAIAHPIAILVDFEKLAVDPPRNLDDCSACLDKLKERLKVLKEKQEELESDNKYKIEDLRQRLQKLDEETVDL